MLPSLCPPVKPFHPAYPRAWFMQLDAILALNGITAQPMMHAVLLQALPVELHHLAAATTSSPQPYDDLCAAVLARYGETYRPLPGTQYGKYYRYNADAGAEYSFDPKENRILVFDSEKGIKQKVCAALIEHAGLRFSMAAYDIDFDQEDAPCRSLFIGRGSYRRVKALRFMSSYTPYIYDDLGYSHEQCMKQVYAEVQNPCCPDSTHKAEPEYG
ncbi:hypothetical protein HPB52_005689 [Rhipicephalus sanguineus]|uniref:DUF7041 domain-containing protein n=1 Tax=Rhipicephalus sanguineus TaxID=34632 RepID=A0A9D4SRI5_RHISA|nr:hypothetical protein HPB52_005689 [Rhipicephalus sanguineus]